MIRVLLAEDQLMVGEALATLLDLEDDIEVVSKVSDGHEVVPAATACCPDIAVIDIEMPTLDGLSAAEELRQALPAVKIVILTAFGRAGFLRRAMDAGANAYLLKDRPVAELAQTLRKVLAGSTIVDPELALAALATGANPLTPREAEVLAAARDLATVSEIAHSLFLSAGTVKNHLSFAMAKLGARNRAEAVRIAEQQGWLRLGGRAKR